MISSNRIHTVGMESVAQDTTEVHIWTCLEDVEEVIFSCKQTTLRPVKMTLYYKKDWTRAKPPKTHLKQGCSGERSEAEETDLINSK